MTAWLNDFPNNIWDLLSISLLIGAIREDLPQFVAIITLIWVAIRISETCTARSLWRRIRRRKFSREDCIMKMGDQ